jgi:serine/threonine-protein kinase RsbW
MTRPRNSEHPAKRAELRAIADAAELGRLRRGVVDFVERGGGDRDTSEALELAVSELATNVLQHTVAPEIRVTLHLTDQQWIVDVASADDLELSETVVLPPVTDRTGRGLFVVQSVMDTVGVLDVDGERVVRATRAAV